MRGGISTELVTYPLYLYFLYEFSEYFQSHKVIRREGRSIQKFNPKNIYGCRKEYYTTGFDEV